MAVDLTTRELMDAVEFAAALLDCDHAYKVGKRVHIPLGGGWTFAISDDGMRRFRVEGCVRGAVRCTLWVDVCDRARLAQLAWDVREIARVGEPNGMNTEEVL